MTDEDVKSSEQGAIPVHADFVAGNNGKDDNGDDVHSCAIAAPRQDYPASNMINDAKDDVENQVVDISEKYFALNRRCSKYPRNLVRVTVNVPPVPDSWRDMSLMDNADEDLTMPSLERVTSQPKVCTPSRRGRPRGSRNRATLRRERRLATLAKTAGH